MEDINRGEARDEYIPRPRWQVWGARIGLVIMAIAIALYYWSIVHPF